MFYSKNKNIYEHLWKQNYILVIYTANKCSMSYAQRCREKKLQLQIKKMILPISLWNKCGCRILEVT